MISYEAIVRQIDKHLTQAKQQPSEAALREQLSAIQALCEVALASDKQVAHPVQRISVSTSVMPPATKLEEQDANGESLFDF